MKNIMKDIEKDINKQAYDFAVFAFTVCAGLCLTIILLTLGFVLFASP